MPIVNLYLGWDNTAVQSSGNAIGQRASKRIKSVGGAFDTSGFTPANTMQETVSSAVALVQSNLIYEFKVECICISGGPVINDNGLQEGIQFSCIGQTLYNNAGLNIGELSFAVTDFDTLAPDINKVKFAIYDSTNTTLLQTSPEINNSALMQHIFTGLTPNTEYVIRVIYGALVNGVQTWSTFGAEGCTYGSLLSAPENFYIIVDGGPVTVGSTLNSVTGFVYTISGGAFPIAPNDPFLAIHPILTIGDPITVNFTRPGAGPALGLYLYKNGVMQENLPVIVGTNNYVFAGIAYTTADILLIRLVDETA